MTYVLKQGLSYVIQCRYYINVIFGTQFILLWCFIFMFHCFVLLKMLPGGTLNGCSSTLLCSTNAWTNHTPPNAVLLFTPTGVPQLLPTTSCARSERLLFLKIPSESAVSFLERECPKEQPQHLGCSKTGRVVNIGRYFSNISRDAKRNFMSLDKTKIQVQPSLN